MCIILNAGLAAALAASAAQELLYNAVVVEALSTVLLLGMDAHASTGLAKATEALYDYLHSTTGIGSWYAQRCIMFLKSVVASSCFQVAACIAPLLFNELLHFLGLSVV